MKCLRSSKHQTLWRGSFMRALRALGAQRWATRKLDAVEACVAKAAGPGSVRGAVQPGIAHSVV
jgi:hypothetical protein